MDLESLRAYCLARPGATEDSPFGDDVLTYRVGAKIFALTNVGSFPPAVNLKCDPERALELRERFEGVSPGYHMNKKHWNTVLLDRSVPDEEVRSMIDHSYDLVFAGLGKGVREGIAGESR